MKADLAAALLHNPDVLFLDEPTIGIDVLAKAKIRDFIMKMNQVKETTIILTTHDISDIESLCRKMLIIDKGSLLYDGTLEKSIHIFGSAAVSIYVFTTSGFFSLFLDI